MKKIPKTKKARLRAILLELSMLVAKLKAIDDHWYTMCCTCAKRQHRTLMDWGHFMEQSRGDSTRFELNNINAQCKWCNMSASGRQYEHWKYIDRKYWEGSVDELKQQSYKLSNWTMTSIEDAINYRTALIASIYIDMTIIQKRMLKDYCEKASRKRKTKDLLLELYNV